MKGWSDVIADAARVADLSSESTMSSPVPAIGIIPARLGSTRFPRKVLARKTGHAMIRHVWDAARRATSLSRVIIATDAKEVFDEVKAFGGEAVMTREDHTNGTSRLAEAATTLRLAGDALVVNVQGDEPELDAGVIDAAVALAREGRAEVATVASPFQAGEDPMNPNLVKVVTRADGLALYFSRAWIPYPRDAASAATHVRALKHVGLYVYRVDFLLKYAAMPPSALETTEMLEQLRVLDAGFRIAVAVRNVTTTGIDTPEQYEEFVRRWAERGAD